MVRILSPLLPLLLLVLLFSNHALCLDESEKSALISIIQNVKNLPEEWQG